MIRPANTLHVGPNKVPVRPGWTPFRYSLPQTQRRPQSWMGFSDEGACELERQRMGVGVAGRPRLGVQPRQ